MTARVGAVTARVGVVVHGADAALSDALVGAVGGADDLGEVRAVETVGLSTPVASAAARLAEVAELVVGLGALPFPGLELRHDAMRDALDPVPYWAVETWHALPAYHDALATALGDAPATGARVLLTAPDAVLRALPPAHRVVLRDVAAAVHERTGARPTVAVDRSPEVGAVTPTATGALTSLVEVHGAGSVVRLSTVPDDGPDEALAAVADRLRVGLRDVAVDRPTHVRLLLDAVRTVLRAAAERDAGDPTEEP